MESTGAVRRSADDTPSPEGVSPRYRAAGAASLRRVELDALSVLYHRESGQTHVVAPPVPELLDALGEDALTRDMLLARLAGGFELPDGSAEALDARLDELVASGLVERL